MKLPARRKDPPSGFTHKFKPAELRFRDLWNQKRSKDALARIFKVSPHTINAVAYRLRKRGLDLTDLRTYSSGRARKTTPSPRNLKAADQMLSTIERRIKKIKDLLKS